MSDIFELFKKISSPKAETSPPEYLVAGLGNPGEKYMETRHNAGFIAMDYICQKENTQIKKVKFKSICGTAQIAGKTVLLMKPQTFMNNSGESIKEASDFYKIPPEKIILIFDDISLSPGMIRIKNKGSDGGQKGARSTIQHLSSDNFPRIKIGVGPKPRPEMDLADWVLSKLTEKEKTALFESLSGVHESLTLLLQGKSEEAMAKYNKKI